jgi:serine/threonine protein kinase
MAATSIQLVQGSQDWEKVPLNETYRGKPFFRKPTNEDDREYVIAKVIKEFPHPNIVKIYRVTPEYIDMELVSHEPPTKEELHANIEQLRSAKEHMHKHGIVYIDWKPDNIGRQPNGKLKIFDFNLSALFEGDTWRLSKPRYSYVFRKAESAGMKTPVATDDWIFNKYIEPHILNKVRSCILCKKNSSYSSKTSSPSSPSSPSSSKNST